MNSTRKAWKCLVIGWMSGVVLLSGIGGVVLCVGMDGHFAFELSHVTHCSDSHSDDTDHGADGGRLPDAAEIVSSCGLDGCSDVALEIEHILPLGGKPRMVKSLSPMPSGVAATSELHAGDAGLRGVGRLGCLGERQSFLPLLQLQRTVVLLI